MSRMTKQDPRRHRMRKAIQDLCSLSEDTAVGEDALRGALIHVIAAAGYRGVVAPTGYDTKPDIQVYLPNRRFIPCGFVECKERHMNLDTLIAKGAFRKYDDFDIALCNFKEFRWRDVSVQFAETVGGSKRALTPIADAEGPLLALLDEWVSKSDPVFKLELPALALMASAWADCAQNTLYAMAGGDEGQPTNETGKEVLRMLVDLSANHFALTKRLLCRSMADILFLGIMFAWLDDQLETDAKELGKGRPLLHHIVWVLRRAIEADAYGGDTEASRIQDDLKEILLYLRSRHHASTLPAEVDAFIRTFLRRSPHTASTTDLFDCDWRDTPVDIAFCQARGIQDSSGNGLGGIRGLIVDPCCGTGTYLSVVAQVLHEEMGDASAFREQALHTLVGVEVDLTSYCLAILRVTITLRCLGVDVRTTEPRIYLNDMFNMNVREASVIRQTPLCASIDKEAIAASAAIEMAGAVICWPPITGQKIRTGNATRFPNGNRPFYGYTQVIAHIYSVATKAQVVSAVVPHTLLTSARMCGDREGILCKYNRLSVIAIPEGRHANGQVNITTTAAGVAIVCAYNARTDRVEYVSIEGDAATKSAALRDPKRLHARSIAPSRPKFWLEPVKSTPFANLTPITDIFITHRYGIKTGDDRNCIMPATRTPNAGVYEIAHKPLDRHYISAPPARAKAETGTKLLIAASVNSQSWLHFGVTQAPYVSSGAMSEKGTTLIFPLYFMMGEPNLSGKAIIDFNRLFGRTFASGDREGDLYWGVDDALHFILGVLGDPEYTASFSSQLHHEVPRIPLHLPTEIAMQYVAIGRGLSCVLDHTRWPNHPAMMDSSLIPTPLGITTHGHEVVGKIQDKDGCLIISRNIIFPGFPLELLSMKMGGFAPLRRFWDDRRGTHIRDVDIQHYRLMVRAVQIFAGRGTEYAAKIGTARRWA